MNKQTSVSICSWRVFVYTKTSLLLRTTAIRGGNNAVDALRCAKASDVINYTNNTRVITDYRYDSFGRRTHTVERTKWGMHTIYDGLTFEVVKEGETTPDSRGITTTGTGDADLYNYNPHGSDHTRGTRYYYISEREHELRTDKNGAALPDRTKGVRTYLYLNGERVAVNNLYNANHGQYYYGSDILGSVRFITGQAGQELNRIEYDIFGGIYKGNSPYGLETGYTGKPYDSVTGLSDYGFRDYSPAYARFITEDPIRDGENWFAYVGNNPVNWVDPWGLSASDGQKKIGTDGFPKTPEETKLYLQGRAPEEIIHKFHNDAKVEEFVSILRSTVGADYSHTRMPTSNKMDCSGMFVYATDKMGYKVDKNVTAADMASGKVPGIEVYDSVDNARQGEKGVLNFYKFGATDIEHVNYGVGQQDDEIENQIVDATYKGSWQAGRNQQGDRQNPKALPDKINKTWAPFSTKTSPDVQAKIDFDKLQSKGDGE